MSVNGERKIQTNAGHTTRNIEKRISIKSARKKKYQEAHRDEVLARSKKYRDENRETIRAKGREYSKKYYQKNKASIATYNREWKKKNPDHACAAKLIKLYGITLNAYEAMFEAQGGTCRICGNRSTNSKRLHVDHNHATGRIRGLLCDICNRGIGMFKDNPDRLRNAADYLDSFEPKKVGEVR